MENRSLEQKIIKRKVFAIGHALMECRYWHEVAYTDGNNYLTEENVLEGRLGFRWKDTVYISGLIEEMFCWTYNYNTYEGSMSDVVKDDWYSVHEKALEDIAKTFIEDPWLAVSERGYDGWEDNQYIDSNSLLEYLKNNIEHDLDIEEVSKIFAIGEYEYLRDEEDDQVEAS